MSAQAARKQAWDWRAASWHARVCPCPQGLQAAELRELSAGTSRLQKPAKENVLLQIQIAALDMFRGTTTLLCGLVQIFACQRCNPDTISATILQLPTPQPPSW